MTVYVDDLDFYPHVKGHWCHMATDGDPEELHKMAAKIGLKREWYQDHGRTAHYDLVASKRRLAIKNGAVPVTTIELIEKCVWGKKETVGGGDEEAGGGVIVP